jgi:GR25 family glycosyltransferase involved in LPS biosynthesis
MKILKDTLNWKYNIKTSRAHIITIKGHENSEKMAARCLDSCNRVGQPAEIFDAFDGTGNLDPDIVVPEHSRNKDWVKWLKLVNTTLSKQEICCFLSHFALWVKCVEEDQPLIALEHDAVMLRPFAEHMAINALIYLGSNEMVRNNYWNPIPPHAQLCPDYRYILRTHAYSVDPICAKNLISDAIRKEIYTAVDVMMNVQKYSILCFGIYAMDVPGETTIPEAHVKKGKTDG